MSHGSQGRVAIVTGGTGGIGLAVCRRLAAEGASVVAVARRDGSGGALVAELGESSALFARGDVSEPGTGERAVDAAIDRYGRLDVLVNNAAVDLSGVPLLDTTLEQIRVVVDVNLIGALAVMQACAARMRERGGSIVNLASRAGVVGIEGMGVYEVRR